MIEELFKFVPPPLLRTAGRSSRLLGLGLMVVTDILDAFTLYPVLSQTLLSLHSLIVFVQVLVHLRPRLAWHVAPGCLEPPPRLPADIAIFLSRVFDIDTTHAG